MWQFVLYSSTSTPSMGQVGPRRSFFGEGTHSVLVPVALSSRSGVRGSCASGAADAQPSPTVAARPSPRLSAGFISRAGCISLPVASTRATD